MGQLRILLADDSSTMHRAVKLALSRGDFDIVCCDNGTDALRICQEIVPAMLIADLDLPGVSGAELVRMAKSDPRLANTRVILLCSSIHQSDLARLDKIPADARLWKPFESDALFTLVQTLLRPVSGKSSTMSSASTQQMNRPEIQRQMVEPSTLVDRTMPPREGDAYGSSPTRLQPFEGEPTSKLSSKDATQNLWTPDFAGSVATPPVHHSPTAKQERTLPGDNLSAYREANQQWESIQARTSSPTPPPPPPSSALTRDVAPQMSREEIRTIVRSEIQLAFDSWFKEKLEAKLQEILSQIESEAKKRS